MDRGSITYRIALAVMVAITVINVVLAVSFVGASSNALAANLDSQSIYPFAGVEMVLVLLAYVVCKNGPIPPLSRSR